MTRLAELPARHSPAGDEQMFTFSKLRLRGWTDTLVKKILGMPDDYCANWAHPSGAPVRLYRLVRVVEAEASQEFQTARSQVTKRQTASSKALDTKREAARRWIEQIEVKLPAAPQVELSRLAVDWHNAAHAWRGDCPIWRLVDDPDLATICVDYIIHQLESFETKLRRAIGKEPGPQDTHFIRSKIIRAIAKTFPWLADECSRRGDLRME